MKIVGWLTHWNSRSNENARIVEFGRIEQFGRTEQLAVPALVEYGIPSGLELEFE